MKRGLIFFGLFLFSLLVISGCEGGKYTGYSAYQESNTDEDEETKEQNFEKDDSSVEAAKSYTPDYSQDLNPDLSGDLPYLSCEDYVYSTCPSYCTQVCLNFEPSPPPCFVGMPAESEDCYMQDLITTWAIADLWIGCPDVSGSCIPDFDVGFSNVIGEEICVDADLDNYGAWFELGGYGFTADDVCEFINCGDEYCNILDCNDLNDAINPGFIEDCDGSDSANFDIDLDYDILDCDAICEDGIDNDCDGLVDLFFDVEEVPFDLQVFQDCSGACFSNQDCLSPWGVLCLDGLSDNYCDDGTIWGIDFDCAAYGYDFGDCSDESIGLSDCAGEDVYAAYSEWLGDGICDAGYYGVDFNCEFHNYDEGDCECNENDVSYCMFDGPNIIGCSEDSTCVYQFCDGEYFVGSDDSLTLYAGLEYTESEDDVWTGSGEYSTSYGGFIFPKKIPGRDDCDPGECSFETFLDLITNDNCDEVFNCSMWEFDGGDCLDSEFFNQYSQGTNEFQIEDGIFNNDLVDTDLFVPGTSSIEDLFNSLLQITEQILLKGYENVFTNGLEYYSFETPLRFGEPLEFTGLFLDANALSSSEIYEHTIYINYDDLQLQLPNNLIKEVHKIEIMDFKGGLSPSSISLKIQSNAILTSLEVGKLVSYDLNNDKIYDINVELLSINEENSVDLRVDYLFPRVSDKFENLPTSEPYLFSIENSEGLVRISSIFVMILVMFIVSFSLIKKAFNLVKFKK